MNLKQKIKNNLLILNLFSIFLHFLFLSIFFLYFLFSVFSLFWKSKMVLVYEIIRYNVISRKIATNGRHYLPRNMTNNEGNK